MYVPFTTLLRNRLVAAVCLTLGIGMAFIMAADAGTPSAVNEAQLIPWLDANGLFGYVDKAKQLRIAAQYDDAMPFFGGLAAVKKGKRWGYINMQGAWLVKPRFSWAPGFSGGHALATMDVPRIGIGKPPPPPAHIPVLFDLLRMPQITLREARVDGYCISPAGDVKSSSSDADCKKAFDARWDWETTDGILPHDKACSSAARIYAEKHPVPCDAPDRELTPAEFTVHFVENPEGHNRWAVADHSAQRQPITPYIITDLPHRTGGNPWIPPRRDLDAQALFLNEAQLELVQCVKPDGQDWERALGIVNAEGKFVVPCHYADIAAIIRKGDLTGFMGIQEGKTVLMKADGTIEKRIEGATTTFKRGILPWRFLDIVRRGRGEEKDKGYIYDFVGNRLIDAGDLYRIHPLGEDPDDDLQPFEMVREGFDRCFYTADLENKGCGYDFLGKIDRGLINACNKTNCGMLNASGRIVIPLLYGYNKSGMEWGYAPIVFDSLGLAKVTRDGQSFYLDSSGYEYRAKSVTKPMRMSGAR